VTGWLPGEQVRALLARAWVYVQASCWRKTPRSLLQAMAGGVPCVADDVPAHREALRDGETGLLAQGVAGLALQVKTLLDDPLLARRLGTAARREAAQRFTLPRLRRSLLALYGLA
jgi:glycosyltransferase involved in cell wall biosynthesis